MSKALDGVRILDFTHVQSGPTCTQLLAWFGADVIKVERPGAGDITRDQLRDIPDVDSLYFTMLNHNKRSITIDTKNPEGKEVLEALVKNCDVLVENFAPGALDRMGFTWEHIQELNPRMIVASVKGFGPGPYEECKVYENVAQCAGGAASTTGFRRRSAARDRRADRRLRHGAASGARHRHGAVSAHANRARPEGDSRHAGRRAQPVPRETARPAAAGTHGPMKEYPQYPNGRVRRSGAARGQCVRRRPARLDPEVQGLGDAIPNAYIYFITQAPVWETICNVIGKPEWKTDPGLCQAAARLPHLKDIFAAIETLDDDQDQVRGDGDPQRSTTFRAARFCR